MEKRRFYTEDELVQMYQDGVITLDDTLGRFLPAPEDKKDITVQPYEL